MEEFELQPWILCLVKLSTKCEDRKRDIGRNARFQVPFLQKPLEDMLHQNVE